MENAIRSLTHLDIISPFSIRSDTAEPMAALLSLLAPMCPALQQLQVKGDVSRGLLVAFGESCRNLFSLKLVTGVSSDNLQLNLIMPRLTHCCYRAAHGDDTPESYPDGAYEYYRNSQDLVEPCCLALLSNTSLTHIDFGFITLRDEMWHALPPGLQSLRCALSDNMYTPPADLVMMEKLQQLELCCSNGVKVDLGHLVQILSVAPAVRILHMTGWDPDIRGNMSHSGDPHTFIEVCITRDSISDLHFLHDRVLAGLAVTSATLEGEIVAGVSLNLISTRKFGAVEEQFFSFMENLPPFPEVSGLQVRCIENTRGEYPSITKLIASTFPSLTCLRIGDRHIKDVDLVHLRVLAGLKFLSLPAAQLTTTALGFLCSRLDSLGVLHLTQDTKGFFVEDGKALQRTLQEWGSHVEVLVRWGYSDYW